MGLGAGDNVAALVERVFVELAGLVGAVRLLQLTRRCELVVACLQHGGQLARRVHHLHLLARTSSLSHRADRAHSLGGITLGGELALLDLGVGLLQLLVLILATFAPRWSVLGEGWGLVRADGLFLVVVRGELLGDAEVAAVGEHARVVETVLFLRVVATLRHLRRLLPVLRNPSHHHAVVELPLLVRVSLLLLANDLAQTLLLRCAEVTCFSGVVEWAFGRLLGRSVAGAELL